LLGAIALSRHSFWKLASHYLDIRLIVVLDYEDLYVGLIVVIDEFTRYNY
jgi:hypothetical protein